MHHSNEYKMMAIKLYLNMTKNNGRCKKGKRCYKTVHVYPFVK